MTHEADNPMTGSDVDWMVSNHAVWRGKAPVKAYVSGVSLLQLSAYFASIFPLFPQKRLILRLTNGRTTVLVQSRSENKFSSDLDIREHLEMGTCLNRLASTRRKVRCRQCVVDILTLWHQHHILLTNVAASVLSC